jgi:hypothetical protein
LLGSVVSVVIASLLTVGAVAAGLIRFGPHEQTELTILVFVQVTIAVGAAVVFAIVLTSGRSRSAIGWTAVVLAGCLLVPAAILDGFGITTSSSAAFSLGDALAEDLPLLLTILGPGLLTILVEWWFVRRLVRSHESGV